MTDGSCGAENRVLYQEEKEGCVLETSGRQVPCCVLSPGVSNLHTLILFLVFPLHCLKHLSLEENKNGYFRKCRMQLA